MSDGPSTLTLQDRVAIITGASEGLGLEIVKQYVLSGASVVMCSRNKEKLGTALERLILEVPTASSVVTCQADVSRPDDVDSLVKLALKKFGRVDILVNNAATNPFYGSVLEADEQAWDKTLAVNLKGRFLLSQHAAGLIEKKRWWKYRECFFDQWSLFR